MSLMNMNLDPPQFRNESNNKVQKLHNITNPCSILTIASTEVKD